MLLVEDPAVDLATPSGPMRTYVYRPLPAKGTVASTERYPGVLLYSEIFQRTPPIHRMAQMIAGNGFLVVVPEIFHELEPAGTVLGYDQAGADAGNRHKKEKPIGAFDSDAPTPFLGHFVATLARGGRRASTLHTIPGVSARSI